MEQLLTEKLRLRRMEPEDSHAIYGLTREENVAKYCIFKGVRISLKQSR